MSKVETIKDTKKTKMEEKETITAPRTVESYCSWCLQKSQHQLQQTHSEKLYRRHIYQCTECENFTVKCRFCDNMAKSASKDSSKSWLSWDNERCAEHDGDIVTFAETSISLKDITEFRTLLAQETPSYSFGNLVGKYLLSDYFEEDDKFDIFKLEKKSLPPKPHHSTNKINNKANNKINKVVLINGFLREKDRIFQDWLDAYEDIPDNCELYGLTWSSKDLNDVVKGFFSPNLFSIASKKLLLAQIAYSAITNPWHVSMKKAADAGNLLGNILLKTNDNDYTLVAHSLGCRVIYNALELLKNHPEKKVKNIILLGGAVGKQPKDWEAVADIISGKIYNCFSENDRTLDKVYSAATLKLSSPVGRYPIQSEHPKIINIDCSDLIKDHKDWKNEYPAIYRRIKALVI